MSYSPIQIKPSHKGLLHKKLGIPEGQPIGLSILERAKEADSPALRREANFAINARKFNHSSGGRG